ncbi:halocarboxylic acid dehydrogenase DehI family protein [Brevibacillus dissolubilis]|uniref:halocarboxylic acid dehydrogenase DehI family protein n=1 Tax=Brevibacillus dissolubilis TaxID=1844116 RepID=UPI001115F596|nr:halocarboxylic acid dehydrogenase DehI family protein [Brevibacillus dissolubilis]
MLDRYGVPEILPEDAQGQLAGLYQDIQFVLKVPVVPFLFRSLALFDRFLITAWEQVRGNMLTVHMEQAAKSLRHPPLDWQVPGSDWGSHYDSETLDQLRRTLSAFQYVNPKLLLITSAWAESLGNRPILGTGYAIGSIPPGLFPGNTEIPLMHPTKAPDRIRELLEDIAGTHHAFDIACDYRALAYYPEFLGTSWDHLKPYVQTPEYQLQHSRLLTESIRLAHTMPYPVTISQEELASCFTPQQIAGIIGMVSLCQHVLPGLIIDTEFFRRMLRC